MRFKNAFVFVGGSFQRSDFEIKEGRFSKISSSLSEKDMIDCTDKLILPGFIDIHTHGCIGYDFNTASVSEIGKMCDYYMSNGITSVLATTMTIGAPVYKKAITTITAAMKENNTGSRILGINMEGPFLGKDKKGAHDEHYLHSIDFSFFEELNELADDQIRIVDIDPNLGSSMDFISKYSKTKTISLAHTSCSYDTAVSAIKAGASHVTHLFNAMNGLHHREPGILGAVSDFSVNAEIICDGIHIHPAVIRIIYKIIPDALILISDSMSAAGLEDGLYQIGGQDVVVENGIATLRDHTLAGSTTNVYRAFKNAVSFGIPIEKAVLSATLHPAKAIGKENEVGSIEAGKRADFIIMDEKLNIEKVYRDGICCFRSK